MSTAKTTLLVSVLVAVFAEVASAQSTGACCRPDEVDCIDGVTSDTCDPIGFYGGDGSTCATTSCGCCFGGFCDVFIAPGDCSLQGGQAVAVCLGGTDPNCDDACTIVCGDDIAGCGQECDGFDDSACPGNCTGDCDCAVCGDNTTEGAEECDGTDDSACPGNCTSDCDCPFCGDGMVEGEEICDRSNDSACPGECVKNCTCPLADAPRFFMAVQGDTPTPGDLDVTVSAGGRVCLEFYFVFEDTTESRGYQMVVGALSGGTVGSVDVDCGTVALNTSHPAYQAWDFKGVGVGGCPPEFIIFGIGASAINFPALTPTYAGEACFDVSSDADGVFVLSFEASETFLTVSTGTGVIGARLKTTSITVGSVPAVRGNNVVEGSEECDETDAAACPGLCTADCTCPPPPTGACCLPGDTCGDMTQDLCISDSGSYAGDGTSCGDSSDCNSNELDDICDITIGASLDCNANGIPDECETGCETASETDVSNGETVTVIPGGGTGELDQDATIEFTNDSGTSGATIEVSETTDPVVDGGSGFATLGTTLLIETSLDRGEFFLTLTIPFDSASLGLLDPLSVDLTWFDGTDWVPAPAGNSELSPGHSTAIGDRFAESGTVTPSAAELSVDLGDYGVFWNTDTLRGFVWANVDHTSAFAPAVLSLAPSALVAESSPVQKQRFVTFVVPSEGAGSDTALRVTLTALYHPGSPFPVDPPDFLAREGEVRYVNLLRDDKGDPITSCLSSSASSTFYRCAILGCQPEYADWAGLFAGEPIQLSGTAIVPDSVYTVSQLAASCAGSEATCVSASVELGLATARYGDTEPSGAVNVTDVVNTVDVVKQVATSLWEYQCYVRNQNPAPHIDATNVTDIVLHVDALKLVAYPLEVPACP